MNICISRHYQWLALPISLLLTHFSCFNNFYALSLPILALIIWHVRFIHYFMMLFVIIITRICGICWRSMISMQCLSHYCYYYYYCFGDVHEICSYWSIATQAGYWSFHHWNILWIGYTGNYSYDHDFHYYYCYSDWQYYGVTFTSHYSRKSHWYALVLMDRMWIIVAGFVINADYVQALLLLLKLMMGLLIFDGLHLCQFR